MKEHPILVTGASGFIGSRLVELLWRRQQRLLLLCRPASITRLRQKLARLGVEFDERIEIVSGDITRDDLGLDPQQIEYLKQRVAEIFHLAAAYRLDIGPVEAWRVNVAGTRRLLELAARLPRLQRFHHVSTMAVAGDFCGVYGEDDFDVGQGFAHAYGHSKFQAEALVRRAGRRLPVTIYRPGIVVGDSRTGSIDKLDGPYYMLRLLDHLRALPGWRHLPMLVAREEGLLFHIVPVDYVVQGLVELAGSASSRGGVFHLMDPRPPSFAAFYQKILDIMGFAGPRLARPLTRAVRLLNREPARRISHRLMGRLGLPPQMLAHLAYRIEYSTERTRKLLQPTGIECPYWQEYVPAMARFFEQNLAVRRIITPKAT